VGDRDEVAYRAERVSDLCGSGHERYDAHGA
jgi:hypothetical protein